MKRALFIGRFQPFHKGHQNAARTALNQYELMIGIGSAQTSGTMDNPLSFEERKQIVQNCFPDVPIIRFEDKADNDVWTDMVEGAVDIDIVISGNALVRRLLGDRGYTVQDPDYLKPEEYSGTEIRRRVVAGEDWTHLVPDCSLELIERFGFAERVNRIAER